MVTDTLHGILNADGTMQVESNDRELRILLKRSIVFDEGRQLESFYTEYYIKDGFEWQKTLNSENYKCAEDFFKALKQSENFSLAVCDIEEQRKEHKAGKLTEPNSAL